MIDAKSFMGFFENEYGVKFKDVESGRDALGIINEQEGQAKKNRVCCKCEYAIKGGEFIHDSDIICGNGDSVKVTEFVSANDSCEYWVLADKECD
jgi:translation initiation factor 2B subunit (eIF-2B alpha/beta/delta family)